MVEGSDRRWSSGVHSRAGQSRGACIPAFLAQFCLVGPEGFLPRLSVCLSVGALLALSYWLVASGIAYRTGGSTFDGVKGTA